MDIAQLVELNIRIVDGKYRCGNKIILFNKANVIYQPILLSMYRIHDWHVSQSGKRDVIYNNCVCCQQYGVVWPMITYNCSRCATIQSGERIMCGMHNKLTDSCICSTCDIILCILYHVETNEDSCSKLLRKSNLQYEIAINNVVCCKMVDCLRETDILGDAMHIHKLMCVRDYVMSSSILGGNYDVYCMIVLKYLEYE